jgi:hypothetical protein
MRLQIFLFMLIFFTITVATGVAIENKGAEMIRLSAGKQGPVTFPHHDHQNRLKDCRICHTFFPQIKGAIEQMKTQGQLKSKTIMNNLCIKCHRTEKKAGNPSGPLTCTKCHQR